MRIYEGDVYETARDITFDHQSDFIMWASLKHARPMANGRVQTAAATSPPVLTGQNCCSGTPLQNPEPCLYFLFTDLAIRHEGRYILEFMLMERMKDARDEDLATTELSEMDIDEEFRKDDMKLRSLVYSNPFTCFSAKKFPGLLESSTLSSAMADQGCKVRIRRDIRMRRRPKKDASGPGKDENESGHHGVRSPADNYRDRSASNASAGRAALPNELHRRSSGIDIGLGVDTPMTASSTPTTPRRRSWPT